MEKRIAEFESFLNNTIKKDFKFEPSTIEQICKDVTSIIKDESSLVKVEGDAIIVGDVHSDLGSVDYCCRKFLEEVKNGKTIVFLGDYVDRGYNAPGGPNGIKNVMLLFKLKTMFPNQVVLLRGNHENIGVNAIYGFKVECCQQYVASEEEKETVEKEEEKVRNEWSDKLDKELKPLYTKFSEEIKNARQASKQKIDKSLAEIEDEDIRKQLKTELGRQLKDTMKGIRARHSDEVDKVKQDLQPKEDEALEAIAVKTPFRKVYIDINHVFDNLSLVAVINDNTFCVHGGIASTMKSLQQISDLQKPISSAACGGIVDRKCDPMICELLWNDPSAYVKKYGSSQRGDECKTYGSVAVKQFRKLTNLNRIIRAHEVVENGHTGTFKDKSAITVFSAPDYYQVGSNLASIIELKGNDNSIECKNFYYSPNIVAEYNISQKRIDEYITKMEKCADKANQYKVLPDTAMEEEEDLAFSNSDSDSE